MAWFAVTGFAATDKPQAKSTRKASTSTTLPTDPQGQLQQIRKEMGTLRQSVKQTERSRAAINAEVRRISKDIKHSAQTLQETREKRQMLSDTLQDLRQEHSRLRDALSHQKQVLETQTLAVATQPQRTAFQALLGDVPPAGSERLWADYARLHGAHTQRIGDYQHSAQQVQIAAIEVDQNRTQTLQAERRVEQQKQDLEQRQQQHLQAEKKLAKTIKAQQQRLTQLQRDARNLDRLLTRLAAEAARRANAERAKQRQQDSQKPSASKPGQNSAPPPAPPVGTGQLSPPVEGPISVRFGASRVQGGMSWQGVIFNVSSGTSVRAIAAGRVVYVGNLRGYGQLMIVDHGNGLMSLYGNLQGVAKSVDATIQAGERIAAVGNSPELGQPGFYFEMRAGRHPVDPLRYLRLR